MCLVSLKDSEKRFYLLSGIIAGIAGYLLSAALVFGYVLLSSLVAFAVSYTIVYISAVEGRARRK